MAVWILFTLLLFWKLFLIHLIAAIHVSFNTYKLGILFPIARNAKSEREVEK
jgi:hypothetical protein